MFVCQVCNYQTEIASNYKKHLKTKKHKNNQCNHSFSNTYTIDEFIRKPHNTSENLTIPHNTSQALPIPHNTSQYLTSPHNTSQIDKDIDSESSKDYVCEYCSRSFSRIDNLNRHIKKYCKKKIDVYEVINELKEERIAMKTEREVMLKMQKESLERAEKEKASMKKQIDFLLDRVGDTTNITNNQNIVLNCYGNEDLSHITDQFKLGLLKLPYSMITKKGTILSSISSIANSDADKNYVLIKNIFEEPIEENFKAYLVNYKTKSIEEQFEIKTNYTNCIEISNKLIKPEIFLVTDRYLGVPMYVSIKNNFLSFEHTHPPHEYISSENKFIKVTNLKKEINEIIS